MARRAWGIVLVVVLGPPWPSAGRAAPIAPAQLDDFSDHVAAKARCCTYAAATGLHSGTVTVTNKTSAATDGQLVVSLKGLAPGVTGADAAGVLEGRPYWLASGALSPGAATTFSFSLRAPPGLRPRPVAAVHRLANGAVNARAIRALSRPFTIAVIPDTQRYVEADDRPGFAAQVRWVLANRAARNVVFVTHVGDVVDCAACEEQWQRASSALGPLLGQAALPFSIVRGNHDEPGAFRAHLPLDQMKAKPWFVEAGLAPAHGGGPATGREGLSQAQVFRVDGASFLHIGFEYAPDAGELAWADRLLSSPELQGLPVIVSTHDYLEKSGGLSENGRRIWDGFVRTHPAVFMVLSGHAHPGDRAEVGTDDAGLPVYQVLSDYQDEPNGGNGLMRLVTVDPAQSRILVETYSAVDGTHDEHPNPRFEQAVDLRRRLALDCAAAR